MGHTEDTNYSFIRPTSNVDGTPAQEILALYDAHPEAIKKFGKQGTSSQDGAAWIIDCQCPMTWASRVAIEPRLSELRFGVGDIPSFLSIGCEDTSHANAITIVQTQGVSGVEWGPVEA